MFTTKYVALTETWVLFKNGEPVNTARSESELYQTYLNIAETRYVEVDQDKFLLAIRESFNISVRIEAIKLMRQSFIGGSLLSLKDAKTMVESIQAELKTDRAWR